MLSGKLSVAKIVTIFIIIIVLVISSFATGFQWGVNSQVVDEGDIYAKISEVPYKKECFRTDVNFNDFSYHTYPYDEYEVVPDDTLMSIARKLLGDDTRANEFVLLNKDRHPSLESQPEYVERGWKLRVPPKDITVLGGPKTINRFLGQLVYITENQMAMRDQATDTFFFLYPDAKTEYIDGEKEITQNDFSTDMCVEVVLGPEGVNIPVYIRILR